MLNVIINKGSEDIKNENYVINPEVYFNNIYEDEWLDDSMVQEMILQIDKSKVLSHQAVESPVLGTIPIEKLSGGVKTLILMYKKPDMIYNASYCGDNCAEWILKISKSVDLTIRLGYLMDFKGTFNIEILNTGKTVRNSKEFIEAYIEVDELDR